MSATITKHEEPIAVDTPFGRALCIAWVDWEKGGEQEWQCVLPHNRAIVFVPHTQIRYAKNYSLGITGDAFPLPKPPAHMVHLAAKL